MNHECRPPNYSCFNFINKSVFCIWTSSLEFYKTFIIKFDFSICIQAFIVKRTCLNGIKSSRSTCSVLSLIPQNRTRRRSSIIHCKSQINLTINNASIWVRLEIELEIRLHSIIFFCLILYVKLSCIINTIWRRIGIRSMNCYIWNSLIWLFIDSQIVYISARSFIKISATG